MMEVMHAIMAERHTTNAVIRTSDVPARDRRESRVLTIDPVLAVAVRARCAGHERVEYGAYGTPHQADLNEPVPPRDPALMQLD
jgi:hypothetical protein